MGRQNRNAKPFLPDYSEGTQIKLDDEDPRFNTALARGLAILRSFDLDRRVLGNVDLAEITGLPKSTISRLTFTLTQLGYLHYREEFGQYELAAGVVGLAYPFVANMVLPMLARPLMAEIAERTGTNVGLGIQEGMSVLYLEYAVGEPVSNRRQRVGFRVPLVRTAMGRACIAGMQPLMRQRLYDDFRDYYGREWGRLHKELEDAVEQVEARGFCIASGTFRRNTVSVAVPYLDSDGRTIFAFNSQRSLNLLSPDTIERNGRLLVELAVTMRERSAAQLRTPALGVP